MTFDKDKYWANRKEGIRGQGKPATPLSENVVPETQAIGFTNDGKLIVKNRAYRRQAVSLYPKSSQLRKKNKRK